MFNLHTKERVKTDKLDALRREGRVPAVIYGAKDEPSLCSVTHSEFIKVWRDAGETGIVQLEIGGDKKDVMIYEVQRNPVSDAPMHIDFYAVTKGQKIEVNVPLEFVGEAPAVKEIGAIIMKPLHDVLVSADARDIPQHIDVNVETLTDLDSQILAKDLVLPSSVELLTGEDEVIAALSAANEEEVDEVPDDVDMATIEVEKKGKKEEEEAEGESV